MLAQAVSRQDKKSETQAAKAQQPKNSELNGKASNKPQQRNLSSQVDSAKNTKTLARPEGVGTTAPGQSPFVSDVSDVSKSLRGNKGENKETGKQQPPEVKSKSGEVKQGADQHKAPAAAEQPSVASGPAAQKESGPAKQVEKGPAKEKAPDASKLAGEKGPGSEKASATPEKGTAKAEKSPKTPEEDPAFQAVVKKAKGVAKQQGQHEPAKAKAAQAQAAAKGPPNEVESQAKETQIEKMDAQEPGHFDKESFKAALLAKIASVAPKNLEEADDFKADKKAASIKDSVTSEVKQGKEGAQGAIKQTTAQPPDSSSAKPKEVSELKSAEKAPAPQKIGAQLAAPKPKTESEVSLKEGSQRLDSQMSEADISEEQLASSNEPQFQDALKSKKDAQQHSAQAPEVYRQEEQAILATSQKEASSLGQTQVLLMHQQRQGAFKKVESQQTSTKSADEQKRAEVSAKIETIYNSTKQKVEARLSKLDEEVNAVFDSGLEQATREFEDYVDRRMSAYKEDRYSGALGKLDWASDKLFGMPDEVNVFYEEGRNQYIDKMNTVIDSVATIVETGLNEAKEMIAAGRQEVKTYVESLPKDLKDVGKQAEENIESKFDELNQSLDEKQNQLVDSLSQKYVDNLSKVDERINEMKAENKGLVDKAKDAIVGAIKTILKLKDMLLGVLAKVASVVTKIIKHPIDFLGNLVKGVKAGLSNFMGKIGDYLEQGMFEWLFGEMTKTGIQMPKAFDFKGILSLVLQLLGLTYPAIRGRAVKLLGEGIVKGLEGASEIFMTLVSEGPAGLWKYIQEKIGDLKETVIEGIKGFLKEKIIIAGITWIVGLLNPASAFIKAAKAIYDIVMFFVTRGSQIMSLVDAIVDSMAAIAEGSFGVAAAAVEKALGKAVPVVIGFLASLLGLGGIGEKIRSIIQKVQAPVTKAVDWIIQKATSLVKGAGKLAGIGKGNDKEEKIDKTDERTTEQKNSDLKQALSQSELLLQNDNMSIEEIEEALPSIEKTYRLKSIKVVVDDATEDAEKIHVHAEVNPTGNSKGIAKKTRKSSSKKSTKQAKRAEAAKGRRQFWILLKNRAPLKRLMDKSKAAHLDPIAREGILQSAEFQKWKERWDKLIAKYASEMEGVDNKDEEKVRETIRSVEDYLDNQIASLSKGDVGRLIKLAKDAEKGKVRQEKALQGFQAGHRVGAKMVESGMAQAPEGGVHGIRNFRLEESAMNEWRGRHIELPVTSLKKGYTERGLSEATAKSQAIKGVPQYRVLMKHHTEAVRGEELASGAYSSESELKKLMFKVMWKAHARAVAEIIENNPLVS